MKDAKKENKKEVPVTDAPVAEATPAAAEAVDAPAESVESMDADPVDFERLATELDERIAETQTLRDQLVRTHADFDNYRKRTARDLEHLRKTATEALLKELLPVVDNLERALGHSDALANGLAEGVQLVLNQLRDVLAARGVEAIAGTGEPFDPNVHEALAHMPSETHPADTVAEVFQRGYRIGSYVLRPAQVVVSSGSPAAGAAAQEQQ